MGDKDTRNYVIYGVNVAGSFVGALESLVNLQAGALGLGAKVVDKYLPQAKGVASVARWSAIFLAAADLASGYSNLSASGVIESVVDVATMYALLDDARVL